MGIIGSSLLTLFVAASSAFSQPDVMMRDCVGDIGDAIAPSYNCGGAIYYSPDVWVRQNNDGGTIDQPPVIGQTAYVNITLYNRGNAPSSCGVLSVYYRDAGPSWGVWPSQWINFAPGGVIRADVVGHLDVCDMQPGETRTVVVPWYNVQANVGVHHCLLARWIASDDPMQTPETSDFYMNVLGNNNVVHRNCQTAIPGSTLTPVTLFNTGDEPITTSLTFDAVDNENGKDVFDEISDFNVKIVFDQETFDKWDGKGDGFKKVDGEPAVLITAGDASLDGITIPPAGDEGYSDIVVSIEPQFPADIPGDAAKKYVWTLEQHDEITDEQRQEYEAAGRPAPFDGVAFEIFPFGNGDEGNGAAHRNVVPTINNSVTSRPELTARPNVLKGNTEINYTLGQSAKVSVVIHDMNGRAVRTLVSNADASAGSHHVEWDGKAADGALVPAGTYFYRLITPMGTVEHQLKIVR